MVSGLCLVVGGKRILDLMAKLLTWRAYSVVTSVQQLRLPTKFTERLLSGPRVSSVAAVSRGSFSVPKYSEAYRDERISFKNLHDIVASIQQLRCHSATLSCKNKFIAQLLSGSRATC